MIPISCIDSSIRILKYSCNNFIFTHNKRYKNLIIFTPYKPIFSVGEFNKLRDTITSNANKILPINNILIFNIPKSDIRLTLNKSVEQILREVHQAIFNLNTHGYFIKCISLYAFYKQLGVI